MTTVIGTMPDEEPGENTEPSEAPPDVSALYHPVPIDHPEEFIRQLTGIAAPWFKEWGGAIRPWFRGMARASFSLEPSLLRYRPRSLRRAEWNLTSQFKQYGARLFDSALGSDLEVLTVMQHHGLPTRLLDWSENAFAALYFAVREFEHLRAAENAIVWVLEPVRLAAIQMGTGQIPFADEKLLKASNLPLPFYPQHASPRHAPQRGTFTLHPFRPQHALFKIALQEVAAGRLSPLRALVIEGAKRGIIRDGMVNVFGSGEFTFFPDLDGLARELRMRENLEGKG